MALKVLKCENCGAKIEQTTDSEILFCSHCGAKFSDKNDTYNTFVTNNQNITKVFMGNSAHEENNQEKINGYIQRLYDAMEQGNFSEAKDYCVTILNKDPYNEMAVTVKGFLLNVMKQSNGRYKKLEFEDVYLFVEYITKKQNINDFIEIFDLAKVLLESVATNPSQHVLDLCKEMREKTEALNNDRTANFLTTLSEFQKGIENCLKKEKELNDELEYYRNDLRNARKKLARTKNLFYWVAILPFVILVIIFLIFCK